MTTELQVAPMGAAAIEEVLAKGNLTALSPAERVQYLGAVCHSLRLNPLTRPFDFVNLQGKLTLYAKRDAADQLRARDGISISLDKQIQGDLFMVTAIATSKDGRRDEDIGAAFVGGLKGADLANAMKKAVTQAKRRVTLSICGLGIPDESELDDVDGVALPSRAQATVERIKEVSEATHQPIPAIAAPVIEQAKTEKAQEKVSEFEQMLDAFARVKDEIGHETYYRILGTAGYEHANQIGSIKVARAIYKDMRGYANDIKIRQQSQEVTSGQAGN